MGGGVPVKRIYRGDIGCGATSVGSPSRGERERERDICIYIYMRMYGALGFRDTWLRNGGPYEEHIRGCIGLRVSGSGIYGLEWSPY